MCRCDLNVVEATYWTLLGTGPVANFDEFTCSGLGGDS